LSWEIGPGINTKYSLTISCAGNPEVSGTLAKIVDKARPIPDWEFFKSRQPKEQWSTLKLSNENITIDASGWKYVLLQYPDNKVEILIDAENLNAFDKETQSAAIEIILINLLGEDLYVEKIHFHDLVLNLEEKYPHGLTSIRFLGEHLKKLEGA
jgi:hypothetical protein